MNIESLSRVSFEKIKKLISSSRLGEAYLVLKNKMSRHPALIKDLDILKSNENTYSYLIDYFAEGKDDPSRQEMLDELKENLYCSNISLYREENISSAPDMYSAIRRFENLQKSSFLSRFEEVKKSMEINDGEYDSVKISPKQAHALDYLFNYVWTIGQPSQEDMDSINAVLDDADIPEYIKSLIISAIILGNIEYFIPDTFEILVNQYENTRSNTLRARTLTGILLISLLNPERLKGNLRLRSRLLFLFADEESGKLISNVFLNLVKTYDTKRIDNKMRNEVIPGLMKLNPDIIDKMRNMASDAENFLSEENPEWEEILENSGISDKLREINDLQLEGADVMVTAFSNLKGFPFFNYVSNWFLPFIPGHYEFEKIFPEANLDLAGRFSFVMCDSDIHSFFLSMTSMPEDKRDLMFANMENQLKEAKEALTNPISESQNDIIYRESKRFIQDLYRFFKFFRKKSDFTDPFELPFLASQINTVKSLFGLPSDTDMIIAEFYFRNKYYEEATNLYEASDSLKSGDFNVWEKLGFAFQKLGNFDKAVEWYKKAEIVNPDNTWLEKKLAVSLKNSGQPEEALIFYQKALNKDPENYHLLLSAAQCLIDKGKYQEALVHLYHANYLHPEKKDVRRALAWAELMNGNFEKADSIYDSLINDVESDKTDFLNAGHTALVTGDYKKALSLYRCFIEKGVKKDVTDLVIAFRDDAAILKNLGIKTGDLRLIVDKLRFYS